MKPSHLLTILAAALLPMLCACDSPQKQLKADVERVAKQTPIDFDNHGKLISISYADDAVTAQWLPAYDFVSVSTLADSPERLRDYFRLTFLNDKLNPVINAAIAAGASITVDYQPLANEKGASITVTPAQMQEIQNMPMLTEDARCRILVNNLVDNINAGTDCGISQDAPEGMKLISAEMGDENLTLVYQVDDKTVADYKSYKNLKDISRHQLKEMLQQDYVMRALIGMLDQMGCGLKIAYTGPDAKTAVAVDFTRQEVHNLTSIK